MNTLVTMTVIRNKCKILSYTLSVAMFPGIYSHTLHASPRSLVHHHHNNHFYADVTQLLFSFT